METFLEQFQQLKVQLKDIKSATDDFSNSEVIGTGGFGKVYIGELSHFQGRSKAAFKRLDRRFGQGDPEFWKEIMMLSRYTHENLISLLGFCDEDGEKILIYEYASNGSLDLHLGSTTFTWIQRLKVCLDAAKGLSYLHDDKGTQQRILHRDIKSSNILIDDNWNAKVSDMGLSKVGPANQPHTAIITNVVGTIGYLDPLYMELGILTKESDVYSFGVVLFEVLCGRLCFEHGNGRFMSLVRMWKQNYKNKKLNEIIFQDLMQEMDPGSLETFSDIAFQCLQKYREKRPTMSLVVEKLKIALELQENCGCMKNPLDYEKIIKTAVYPLKYKSEEELKSSISKGILLNRDKPVSKEASDMVLADDNISSTVAAVGEGRSTYNNMKPFIRYMIASNIAEVAPIFLTAAIGIPEGLIPVQLLWVKLVTYGPPATALAFNPPDKYIMKNAPRRSDDSQISAWILFRYLVTGLYVGIATVGVFVIWYTSNSFFGIDLSQDGHTLVTYSQLANWGQFKTRDNFTVLPFKAGNQVFNFDSNPCDYFQGGKVKAMTLSLSVLVSIEMFNFLNALTEDESLLTMPPWVNLRLLVAMSVSFGLHFTIVYVPFLAQVFEIVPLSINEWLLVLAVALLVKLIDETLKFVGRLTNRSQPDRSPSRWKTE